ENEAMIADLMTEANLSGYAVTNWYGLFGPEMMANQLVEQVALDVSRVLELPDIRSRFDGLGIETVGSSPRQFADLIKLEFDVWTRVIKAADLRAE
ncbi:MAG: tripartite tricarboxylate transporter substrate-binding protein, partial [Alcaligenaceae bacterium]